MSKNRYAIVDCRLSKKCKESLMNLGFSLIELNVNNKYDNAIAAHPDIFVFSSGNKLIVDESVKNSIYKLYGEKGIKVVIRTNVLESKVIYPDDCSLNFAKVGKYLIGKREIANEEILKIAREEEYEFINVNQGYTKCNICVVSDNAIITEDKGIAKECTKNNIDVLLLKTHSVKLDGYDYGFIGGSSGTEFHNESNIVYFCGCIEKHPEHEDIIKFCKTHNADIVSLSDEDLYDRGSIFFL